MWESRFKECAYDRETEEHGLMGSFLCATYASKYFSVRSKIIFFSRVFEPVKSELRFSNIWSIMCLQTQDSSRYVKSLP